MPQVTVEYADIGTPVRVEKVVCSVQHPEDMSIETVRSIVSAQIGINQTIGSMRKLSF